MIQRISLHHVTTSRHRDKYVSSYSKFLTVQTSVYRHLRVFAVYLTTFGLAQGKCPHCSASGCVVPHAWITEHTWKATLFLSYDTMLHGKMLLAVPQLLKKFSAVKEIGCCVSCLQFSKFKSARPPIISLRSSSRFDYGLATHPSNRSPPCAFTALYA